MSAFVVSGFGIEGLGDEDTGRGRRFPASSTTRSGGRSRRPYVLDGRLPDATRADEVVVSTNFVEHFATGSATRDVAPLLTGSGRHVRRRRPGWSDGRGHDRRRHPVAVVPRQFRSIPRRGVFPSPGLYAEFAPNFLGDHGVGKHQCPRQAPRSVRAGRSRPSSTSSPGLTGMREHRGGRPPRGRQPRAQRGAVRDEGAPPPCGRRGGGERAHDRSRHLPILQRQLREPRGAPSVRSHSEADAIRGRGGPGDGGDRWCTARCRRSAGWASQWFPIGSAALIEPTPGIDVDVLVLVGVIAAMLVLVVGVSIWSVRAESSSHR